MTVLARLAPPLLHNEALSSWLARTAAANLLSFSEVGGLIGASLTSAERGDISSLERISHLTKRSVPELLSAISGDLISVPLPAGPPPPRCWAICPTCLDEDVGAGRVVHIRKAWAHPMACWCGLHDRPLVPHGSVELRVVSRVIPHLPEMPEEPDDILLPRLRFDDPNLMTWVCEAIEGSHDQREWMKLRCAISDVVDALTTQRRPGLRGSLIGAFEEALFDRPGRAGSFRLPAAMIAEFDAASRLAAVRIALAILAEPPDPSLRTSLLPPGWLEEQYRHSRYTGWQRTFADAVHDPLVLIVIQLPAHAVEAFNARTHRWPTHLRRRWTYNVAVGAMGDYLRP